ncbi:MAG: hypothetical protein ACK5UO_17015, partial [Microcystis sp.]|uniref:hypothetical protein n=1 Tax=Microcystis sp. TaxID=1127 RepID=UPI00391BA768
FWPWKTLPWYGFPDYIIVFFKRLVLPATNKQCLPPPTFLITFVNVLAMKTSSLVGFIRLYNCVWLSWILAEKCSQCHIMGLTPAPLHCTMTSNTFSASLYYHKR